MFWFLAWFSACLLDLAQTTSRADVFNEGFAYCENSTVLQSTAFVRLEFTGSEDYDGIYLRRDDIGPTVCDGNCSFEADNAYWGTYVYEKPGDTVDDPSYYLWETSTSLSGAGTLMLSQDDYCNEDSWILRAALNFDSTIVNGDIYGIWTASAAGNDVLWADAGPETLGDVSFQTFCDATGGVVAGTLDVACNTPTPTSDPTPQPIKPPTASPSGVTVAPSLTPTNVPTGPSESPTNAPSNAPTARPTHLPTESAPDFPAENCDALQVLYLENAFPAEESNSEFKIDSGLYNGRSTWSNGRGLSIYYVLRFGNQHWVITNGSYTLIREDPSNSTIPGESFVSFDHYPNDNILSLTSQQYTLLLSCFASFFPSNVPSPSPTDRPTTVLPTEAPVTPTSAPTIACKGIDLFVEDITCSSTLNMFQGGRFRGLYAQQDSLFNNKYWWRGIYTTTGDDVIYFNEVYNRWVIDTDDEWAMIEENDDGGTKFEVSGGVYPPFGAPWTLKKSNDNFFPECLVNVTYECVAEGYPTLSPVDQTPMPTTPRPTKSPTPYPTNAPTKPPSNAPTHSPTIAPTSAPTSQCEGMLLTGGAFNETSGQYNQGNDTINERDWWYNINNDATLFYSPSVLHETWVLYSASRSEYYLSQNTPPEQPAGGLWDYYIGASPFVSGTVELEILCYDTRYPTPSPTFSPTGAPTASPVTVCDFARVSFNNTPGEDDPYEGYYSQNRMTNSTERISWTSRSDSSIGIFYDTNSSLWYLGTQDTGDSASLTVDYDDDMPPGSAVWEYNVVDGEKVAVEFDCLASISPTAIPSSNPTNIPTQLPTSACLTLEFVAEEEFSYSGVYFKQGLSLNGRSIWKSEKLSATIAYDGDGYWVLATSDDEPVLVEQTSVGSDYFPPTGTYKFYPSGDAINITTACYAEKFSTTTTTTINDIPYWISCDDAEDEYFFDFIPSGSESVVAYWDTPIAEEASGGDIIVTNAEGYISGNTSFTPGMYTITYTANDSLGAMTETECIITLVVVGGADEGSFQTCFDNSFSISATINSTYYITDFESLELTIGTSTMYEGYVSNEELNDASQNCFVQLEYVTAASAVGGSSSSGGTTVAGSLEEFDYWPFVVMGLGFWLCVVTVIIWRCVCRRKNEQQVDGQRLLAETAASAGDSSVMAGIADAQMMRKATLTGAAVVGSPKKDEDEHKVGDVELGTLTPGGPGAPDPALEAMVTPRSPSIPAKKSVEGVEIPTNARFWVKELEFLNSRGYVNNQRSISMLVEFAIVKDGEVQKYETGRRVEKKLLRERLGTLRENAHSQQGVQKEWEKGQQADKRNAPQASIAPPTMSSLVDSSGVLNEDGDNDDMNAMDDFKNTKGGPKAFDHPVGGPPAPPPVPAAVGGGGLARPKRKDIGDARDSTHLDL